MDRSIRMATTVSGPDPKAAQVVRDLIGPQI